ncbi:scavenger receptor cysteine-rich domain-containing group B protein [Exaiptasia diaphana]|uniref:SRCR domain-containing protein n=1 Tax=Exaiptasia diaphana TaxID=2652724 RepID=A0A913XNK8_EXADI|nr:scavenger receptor cysteine-rich domain-containing group B protein [Exaiptasia diaphana]
MVGTIYFLLLAAQFLAEKPFVNGQSLPRVRLVNGSHANEGRVEVYHNGQWGTVCDDSWDIIDANVVCRQLNLPPAVSAPGQARFGSGRAPFLLDNVGCNGNETSLDQCPSRGWGVHHCYKGWEEAGVVCGISTPSPSTDCDRD